MSDTLPPLPEPTLEDVAGELWGQNIVYPALYTADQMREYAAAALAAAVAEPLTDEQMRDLVKDCGLDWHRGYAPLFAGDETNRYAVLIVEVQRLCGISAPKEQA